MEGVQKNEENLKIYFLQKRTAFEYIWNKLINEKEDNVNPKDNHQKILDFLKKQTGNEDIVKKDDRSAISEGSYSMNQEDLEFKIKFEELKKNEEFQKIFSDFLKNNSLGSNSSIERESNLINSEKESRTSLDFSIKNNHNQKRLSDGEAFNLESVKQSLDQNISRAPNLSSTQFNIREQDPKNFVEFDKFNKHISINKEGTGPTSEDVLYWENVKTSALETWRKEGNIQDIDLLDSMYYQMRLYILSTLECCEKLKTGNYKNRISLLEQFISFLRLSREYLNEFIAAVKDDKKHAKDILIKGSNDMHKFLLVATTEFLFSTGQTENLEIFKKQVIIY
jgi:hypothetical protein